MRRHDDARIALLAVMLSALAVAYFYAVDRLYFSSRFMSSIFQSLLMVDDFNTVWLSLAICAAASLWKYAQPAAGIADFAGRRPGAVALLTLGVLAAGSHFVYHDTAFAMDEYAAIFQAKVFAAGRFTGQLPPSLVDWLVPPGFNGAFLVASRATGAAVEAYWPGFSALLAPFEALHVGWLCNPCLTAIALVLIHRITLDLSGDRRTAGWAVMLSVASGAFLAYAMSYYSMQAHLTLNLLYAWLLFKPQVRLHVAAGVVGSVALVLHQPFPHAMFAAPWMLSLAFSRERRPLLLALWAGYLPVLLFVGMGWLYLRGSIMADDSGFAAFGNNLLRVFSIPDKSMIDMRVAGLVKMWVWAVPGLSLLAALGYWRNRADVRVRLLAGSALFTFVGYVFVIFDQGHGWGYRYFHSAWGVIPVLAALSLSPAAASGRTAVFAGAAALLNLLLVVPNQLIQMERVISAHNDELPPLKPGVLNVYFVRYPSAFYVADLIQNDPFLRGERLMLFSHGSELDAELRRQNWPAARRVGTSFGVEQWQLAPGEQWVALADSFGTDRYMLQFTTPK